MTTQHFEVTHQLFLERRAIFRQLLAETSLLSLKKCYSLGCCNIYQVLGSEEAVETTHSILSLSHKTETYLLVENLSRVVLPPFIFYTRQVSVLPSLFQHYCKFYFIVPVLNLPLKNCV